MSDRCPLGYLFVVSVNLFLVLSLERVTWKISVCLMRLPSLKKVDYNYFVIYNLSAYRLAPRRMFSVMSNINMYIVFKQIVYHRNQLWFAAEIILKMYSKALYLDLVHVKNVIFS